MITSIKTLIIYVWNFLFNHSAVPLRHILSVKLRHLVLQVLRLMWADSFSTAVGNYTVLGVRILGHMLLIAAAALTVATFTDYPKQHENNMKWA